MILFDLKCANQHVFEAWFRDSGAFEAQAAGHEITCPICGDSAVAKALMAPAVANARKTSDKSDRRPDKAALRMGQYMTALSEMRQHVEQNCDYVGEKFPEEARKIHYGEAEHRDIYGEASNEEATELKDEGVAFKRIPWVPPHDA